MPESMTVKIRNFTGYDLARAAYGLTSGKWGTSDNDEPPQALANGGTTSFYNQSADEFSGVEGYVEYQATPGTFRIEWCVPNMSGMGDALKVTAPAGYEDDVVGDVNGATPSVKVILEPPE